LAFVTIFQKTLQNGKTILGVKCPNTDSYVTLRKGNSC